jgi:hypothetical protein
MRGVDLQPCLDNLKGFASPPSHRRKIFFTCANEILPRRLIDTLLDLDTNPVCS